MSQEQIKKARTLRRRRVRERQAVVFGLLAALLGAAGLWAVGVYNGAIALPFDNGFTYEEPLVDEVFDTACLPADTKPVGAKKITVNVFNASLKPGIAAGVSGELRNRNITVENTANADIERATTAIVFGPEGIEEAYTLAAHFGAPALILDDTKEDNVIDVLLGQNFSSLLDPADVLLEADEAMNSYPGCKELWEMTDKVEAPVDEDDDSDDVQDDLEDEEEVEEEAA